MRVTLADGARYDLDTIFDYVASENPAAARRLFEEIKRQIMSLAEHPEIGRVGRVDGSRELVINRTPYIAVYRIKGRRVELLRILHGARQWPQSRTGGRESPKGR